MKKLIVLIVLLTLSFTLLRASPKYKFTYTPVTLNPPIQNLFLPKEVLLAIIWVESGNDGKGAYNREEPWAVGILQEWPILVRDVNRILGYKKYTYADRKNDTKAIEMFWIYQKYYNPEMNLEKMARIWCGGPEGDHHKQTLSYLQLVKTRLYNPVAIR